MKPVILAAACAAAIYSTPAAAELVFQGTLKWISAKNCTHQRAGYSYNSTYHPRSASNANFSGLTTLYQFGGSGYQLNNADFGPTLRSVDAVALGWSGYTFKGAKLSVFWRQPEWVDDRTEFVVLKGQIVQPSDDKGVRGEPCIVTYEGAYRRE